VTLTLLAEFQRLGRRATLRLESKLSLWLGQLSFIGALLNWFQYCASTQFIVLCAARVLALRKKDSRIWFEFRKLFGPSKSVKRIKKIFPALISTSLTLRAS